MPDLPADRVIELERDKGMQEFQVRGDYVTLGQLVKLVGPVQSGGEARVYLSDGEILVNGEPESRRGRKLRPGDFVLLPGAGEIRIIARKD